MILPLSRRSVSNKLLFGEFLSLRWLLCIWKLSAHFPHVGLANMHWSLCQPGAPAGRLVGWLGEAASWRCPSCSVPRSLPQGGGDGCSGLLWSLDGAVPGCARGEQTQRPGQLEKLLLMQQVLCCWNFLRWRSYSLQKQKIYLKMLHNSHRYTEDLA